MNRKLYQELASVIDARLNCKYTGNTEWFERHTERLEQLQRDYLPSGSGIDSGTKIDLDHSTGDRIVLTFGFHHMNEAGMYDGWTEHTAIVTASLVHGMQLRITGRDRNGIKDYLHDTFNQALCSDTREQ